MSSRFKLTPDNTVHIDNGEESYTDTLTNAVADIAAAGLTIPMPNLEIGSGLVTVVGFEISPARQELILENGWHYPVPEAALSEFQPCFAGIENLSQIVAAKAARLAAASNE